MMYKQSVMENKQFNGKTIALTACSVCQVQICFFATCAGCCACWVAQPWLTLHGVHTADTSAGARSRLVITLPCCCSLLLLANLRTNNRA
jgi:hypothetical protein